MAGGGALVLLFPLLLRSKAMQCLLKSFVVRKYLTPRFDVYPIFIVPDFDLLVCFFFPLSFGALFVVVAAAAAVVRTGTVIVVVCNGDPVMAAIVVTVLATRKCLSRRLSLLFV